MKVWSSALLIGLLSLQPAAAAPTDVVFQGGMVITGATNCANWSPSRQLLFGTYFVPVAGSTNGPDSTLTFHFNNRTAEGFTLSNGVFTSAFNSVQAVHVYTRTGTYPAFVQVTSQSPATITKLTTAVKVVGAVRGWDRSPTCVVTFELNASRDPNP